MHSLLKNLGLSSESIFGEAKDTIKRAQYKKTDNQETP
jgi:hypothetical protein